MKRVKDEGTNIERAAVSNSTLSRYLKIHKVGNNEVFRYKANSYISRLFTPNEEDTLKKYLQQASQIHYGLTRKRFRILANDIAFFAKLKGQPYQTYNGSKSIDNTR